MTPLLLDLFCGAGGAARGYHDAGFDVVGVDINPQPRYPYDFIQADALQILRGMVEYPTASGEMWRPGYFDAVHASPPCQWGTAYRRRPNHVRQQENLVEEVRDLLRLTGLPFVIEQPWGNRRALIEPIMLCGSTFGLDVQRHRGFECEGWLPRWNVEPCRHDLQAPRFPPATNRTNLRRTVEVGVWRIPLETQQKAMGIDWMDLKELSQAIPPAYTRWIGAQLLDSLRAAA
jgi:DNA (cytosine-5)-methyltransferase 1